MSTDVDKRAGKYYSTDKSIFRSSVSFEMRRAVFYKLDGAAKISGKTQHPRLRLRS